MIQFPKIIPTLDEEFEEGYSQGFDDGYDMAILAEKDKEWVWDLVDMCANCNDKNNIEKIFNNKYDEIMEKRKTGISFIFELDGGE